MKPGEIGILNVGAGDTKLTFDPTKPEERKHAANVVGEMIRLGYAIMVKTGEKDGRPMYQRASAFDQDTCEYLIVDSPEPVTMPKSKGPTMARSRGRKRETVRLPAARTHAVSIARSAGG